MSDVLSHDDLRRLAKERRFAATEDRMQLTAELAILSDEAEHYDEVCERAAPLFSVHTGGGCVVGLLSDDGRTLTPLGIFHPDPEAHAALSQLAGEAFTPLDGVEDAVLREGRGRLVEMTPELFAVRPGVPEYIAITGHRDAAVVPLRTRGRTIGVLWQSADRALDDDDIRFLTNVGSRLAVTVDSLRLAEGDRTAAPARVSGPAAVLTAREREILVLIADGLTSREIAEQLVVSTRTIEWHRARMQAKLDVSGRAELTRVARESGLQS